MRLSDAIDLWLGDLRRRNRSWSTLDSYRRYLDKFADGFNQRTETDALTLEDYERFVDRYVGSSPATIGKVVSMFHGFSTYLYDRGYAAIDVARPLKRPMRKRPEDLDVVTVSSDDVRRMLDACADEQELLCISTAVYLGARRSALAKARRGDVDLVSEPGTIRFVEKGDKVIVKPLPDEYRALLRQLDQEGFWLSGDDYLIPNRKPWLVRNEHRRSNKIIWNTVKRVAGRARIVAHPHALRAAFAVQFDEAHPDQVIALKELLGHSRLDTTLVYLRRKNKAKAMETVRDLSWGSALRPHGLMPPAGFEPASRANTESTLDAGSPADEALGVLRTRLNELRSARSRERQS